jgi:hypothetical protein
MSRTTKSARMNEPLTCTTRISLILGRPFLRDIKARIDVGAQKISLRIMGRNMMFRFEPKEEQFYLIHQMMKGSIMGRAIALIERPITHTT